MVKVEVNPGACGFIANLTITADAKQQVKIDIESNCTQVLAMEAELQELNGYKECFAKHSTSTVYQVAEKHLRHLACPVPTAIIKGMEVACGLNVAKEVGIKIEKE
ncbi:MAG: hypothetical protein WCI30_03405 [Clostridia bacterium]